MLAGMAGFACLRAARWCGKTCPRQLFLHAPFEPSSFVQKANKTDPKVCLICWLGWLGSNQRMPESKSGALPLGYTPIFTVIFYHIKVKLSTFSFTILRSFYFLIIFAPKCALGFSEERLKSIARNEQMLYKINVDCFKCLCHFFCCNEIIR